MTTAAVPPPRAEDAPEGEVPECPYVGLVPFDEKDAAYFFGRECESDLIVDNLTASRLTLLYAPSGVGKTSVLRAGVLPHLRQIDDDSFDDLSVPGAAVAYVNTWRGAPLETIAAAVVDAVSQMTGTVTGEETAGASKLSVPWLHEVLRRSKISVIYLILDQFEEYFLYHPMDLGEEGFTAELGRILSARNLPVHVLLSMREDALAGLDRFEGRVPHLFDNYLRLAHLNRDSARAAIEGPLDRYNRVAPPDQTMSIEPGLIETLLDQVRAGQVRVASDGTAPDGFSGALASDDRGDIETPYLQLVLTRLWNHERVTGSSSLRQHTLNDLGGAQTIVQTHLDNVMAGLRPAQVDVAAAVFHHLVTASGAKIALTAEDLADWSELPVSAVQDLLDTLCSGPHRILRALPPTVGVAGPPRYEIFHDVMGSAVLDWRTRYITQRQQIESSRLLVAERQEAQRAARIARRRLRRTQLVTLSMAVMLLVVSGLSYLFYVSKREAQQQRYLSEAAATITSDPVQSLKSAVEAYKVNADAPARSAVLTAASSSNSRVVAGPNPRMSGIVPTPDLAHVVAYDPHGTIRVIGDKDAVEREVKASGLLRGAVQAAAVNPDASRVALGTDRGTVAVINTVTGQHINMEAEGESTPAVSWIGSAVNGLILVVSGNVAATYSPETGKRVTHFPEAVYEALPLADGQHIVTSGKDRKLRVWDARTAMKIAESSTLTYPPGSLRRYGQSVVGVTPNLTKSSIVVWNWQAGPDPAQYPLVYYNDITGVDVDEENKTICIALDKGLRRYSLVDGSPRGQLQQADSINYVANSPNGQWITTAGNDGSILIWRVPLLQELPRRPTYELLSHRGAVKQVSYVGDSVVSIGVDGMVRRWELPRSYSYPWHGNWVIDMDISRDGSLLATAGSDGHAFIVDLNDRTRVADVSANAALSQVRFDPTEPHRVYALEKWGTTPQLWHWGRDGKIEKGQIYNEPRLPASDYLVSIAISPDGTIIAGGDTRGSIHLWDARTGKLRTDRVFRCTGPPYVTFDPFGQLLAAADQDGVRLWKLGTTESPTLLSHPNASSVNFDPSGRRLVSMAQDLTLNVWTRDGKLEKKFVAHDNPSSNPPSFSRDRDLLAVGTADGLVQVWDVNSGVTVTLDRHHSDSIYSILFLPGDSSRLISAGADTTIVQFSCPACGDQERVIREAIEWAKTS